MRTLLAASTGKDSVWALQELRNQGHEVVAAITMSGELSGRVPFQLATPALIAAHAASLGVVSVPVTLPSPCSPVDFESALNMAAAEARRDFDIEAIAFADVYREDKRTYRENLFHQMDLATMFPLWGLDTRVLAHTMIDAGLEAIVTAIRVDRLTSDLLGHAFNHAFLEALPEGVDPCGELGGFRTFAYNGPMFAVPVPVRKGQTVQNDGYVQMELDLAEIPIPVG